MFSTILVATGGSPWSSHAVDAAIRLATSMHSALIVTHILEDNPPYHAQEWDTSDPQFRAHMEETGSDLLAHAAQRAAQSAVTCRTVAQWGDIPEQIVETATSAQCDLIVMGTRHLAGNKRLMTGRICNAVIATAPCPVLVVPFVQ